MPNLLVTGSKGLLASHLKPLFKQLPFTISYLDIDEMDITSKDSIKAGIETYKPDVVLHLAAFTDVALAESKKKDCYRVNVWGTGEIAKRVKHMIYMSTEYVFDGEKGNYNEGSLANPVNYYSLTKYLGEIEAMKAPRHSIIRALFKPRPFKHEYVATDMWTSGDYVDVMAKKIALAVEHYLDLPEILHIGTGKKNLFELAKQTRKDVKPIKRMSLPIRLPRDTSLDTTLWDFLRFEKEE